MSFLTYIRDKKYFIGLYVAMMLFVSLIMFGSVREQKAIDNIAYMNAGCLLLAASYLVIGYFYRNSFYRELRELAAGDREEWAVALPAPQSAEQELYLELLRRLHRDQSSGSRKLVREMKDHQDFILSWIHEVKLPIAASRLLMENRTGKTSEYLIDNLEDELGKIDGYVEQALYYSRIDSFSRDYFITDVSLVAVAKAVVKKHAKLFISKRIKPDMDDSGLAVHSDAKWLAYIVDQIVANALVYTGEGGSIAFRYEDGEQEKRLVIRDTGIGIDPADIPRVFDKGFTGSNGRAYGKSTGMGLYLARQMALKLGHELSIASVAGAGTTVTIHFPQVRHYNEL